MSNLAEGIAPDPLIAQGNADFPTPPPFQSVLCLCPRDSVAGERHAGAADHPCSHRSLPLTGEGNLPYSPLFHRSCPSDTDDGTASGPPWNPPPDCLERL